MTIFDTFCHTLTPQYNCDPSREHWLHLTEVSLRDRNVAEVGAPKSDSKSAYYSSHKKLG